MADFVSVQVAEIVGMRSEELLICIEV